MILVWTTKNHPTSALIRWGLDEPMSHFASAFFATKKKGLVVEQKMIYGFDVNWLPYFAKANKIVYALQPIQLSKEEERKLLHGLMNEFSGTDYDSGSFLYFCYRAFLRKFFGKPLPNRGKWGDKSEPLCTGHARIIYKHKPEWFSKPINDFDIVTPGALYDNMKQSNMFIDRSADWQK